MSALDQIEKAVEAAERDPAGGKVLLPLDVAKRLLATLTNGSTTSTKGVSE